MESLANASGGGIVLELAERIVANRAFLSELDGKIGDGDHGVNMAKGFAMAAGRLADRDASFSEALDVLGDVLLTEIGGSMGPLYGAMFGAFAEATAKDTLIDAEAFSGMLNAGLEEIRSIGSAGPGDKTLLDTLVPALAAFDAANAEGRSFADALRQLSVAAEQGRDSTRDMVARIGRAARLGERSRGVVDAGAASCAIILTTIADGFIARLS